MKIKFVKVKVVQEPAQELGSAGSTLCTGLPGVRAFRQHGPQLGKGRKKPLRCLQSKRVALGPVQPLQSPDLPLEVGMILTACQAQPLEDHSQ